MKLTWNKAIIPGILLLGLFLKIYDLSGESLWVDEGISIKTAHLTLPCLIKDRASHFHMPLYFIILRYWIRLFGESEFNVRFLSAIFGVLTVFMAYKLGKLIFDKETGIIASLLLALSTFHIHHSQEARMYSMLAALTLCSFYFFIRLLKEKKIITSIGYVISSFLLIYTHYLGLCAIIVQNIYFAMRWFLYVRGRKIAPGKAGSKPAEWLSLQVILTGLFMPWVNIVLSNTDISNFADRMLGGRLYIHGFLMSKINTMVIFFYNWASRSVLLLCVFLLLSFLAILRYEKNKSGFNKIYLLLIWLSIPVIMVLFLLAAHKCWPKYSIVASLAFYLLAAKGLRGIKHAYVKKIIIGAIIIFSIFNIYHYSVKAYNQQWREAVNYIDIHIKPDDLLLFLDTRLEYIFDYYSSKEDSIKKEFFEKGKDIKNYSRVWFIQGKPDVFVKDTMDDIFGGLYKTRVHRKYSGMNTMTQTLEIYLFEKKSREGKGER